MTPMEYCTQVRKRRLTSKATGRLWDVVAGDWPSGYPQAGPFYIQFLCLLQECYHSLSRAGGHSICGSLNSRPEDAWEPAGPEASRW